MKLRVAKKVHENVSRGAEDRYRSDTIDRAIAIYDRLPTTKLTNEYWDWLMKSIGIEGRAKLLAGWGQTGAAFDLLMREGTNPNP